MANWQNTKGRSKPFLILARIWVKSQSFFNREETFIGYHVVSEIESSEYPSPTSDRLRKPRFFLYDVFHHQNDQVYSIRSIQTPLENDDNECRSRILCAACPPITFIRNGASVFTILWTFSCTTGRELWVDSIQNVDYFSAAIVKMNHLSRLLGWQSKLFLWDNRQFPRHRASWRRIIAL